MTGSTQDGAPGPDRNALAGTTFEIVVRSVIGLALLWYCLTIVAPFLHAVLWGAFLAVALYGPFQVAVRAFGGRTRTTAVTFALVGIAVIVLPAVLLAPLPRTTRFFGSYRSRPIRLSPWSS